MNRFFRSALFPLIIIAALVWLALQTLGGHGTKQEKATLSEVIQRVSTDPQSIEFPEEMVRQPALGVALGIAHWRPEGAAWGRLVIFLVTSMPGGHAVRL